MSRFVVDTDTAVTDTRDGTIAWISPAPRSYGLAESVRDAMNAAWERDVAFVGDWIQKSLNSPGFPERDAAEWWREEMGEP